MLVLENIVKDLAIAQSTVQFLNIYGACLFDLRALVSECGSSMISVDFMQP